MTASTPATPDPLVKTVMRIEANLVCRVHRMPDCSPLLNGCSRVNDSYDALASLAAELAATRQALERLASTESFTGAFDATHAPPSVLWDELRARGKYALAVLDGEGQP